MAQIDRVTRATAESASAAERLSAQAGQMRQVVADQRALVSGTAGAAAT